ncbi:MAG: metallophosphoesterase [Marinifilaceae bacterium]|nr:metallophosphoesterase [Marinifilaceae bacterium]
MKREFWIITFFLFLWGCNMVEYHPYDVRLSGETGINAKNIARVESLCRGKDTVRFILMGDTQRYYDETEDFVRHVNGRDDVDFVIHGGDVSDFGLTKEFMWVRDIMNKLTVPYVTLLGNHDVLGNGLEVFEEVFGEVNFSFMAGNTRFICLNTNALEFDYSHPIPDFEYIYSLLSDTLSGATRTIPVMHVGPGDVEFNNNVSRVFHELLKRFPGMQFCLHAHNHRLLTRDLFGDGIMYYGCSYMNDRNYLLFTLTPDGYAYEVVDY